MRNVSLFSLGALILSGLTAYSLPVTRYKAAPVATLNIPVTTDSTSVENPFSDDMLLNAHPDIPLQRLRNITADWTTMTTDSTGNLTLVKGVEKPLLHTFSTRLRAPRYTEGKIVLTSNARGEVTVNGKSVTKKSSCDSVPSPVSGELKLNPEADYEIRVNILSMPADSVTPQFKVEYIPEEKFMDIAIEEGADLSRRFSTLSTMTGDRAYWTQVSPDGKYTLIYYSERFSADKTSSRMELIETKTGKVLRMDLPASTRWIPSGSTLYYTTEAFKGYTLWQMKLPSMAAEIMAENIPSSSFYFTPDARYLIYYKDVEGKKDEGPLKRVQSPDDRIPGDRDRKYLMRYDLQTNVSAVLTYGGATTNINDISRDGSKLLFSSTKMKADKYPLYFTDLIQMDLNTLKCDTILRNDPFVNGAIYSPDARKLFIVGSPQAFNGVGANAGDHEIPNDFDIQGFIYTIADGSVIPVTKDFDPAVEGTPVWNPSDGNIYFRGESGFGINLYTLNPKTLKISQLPAKLMNISGFSIGDNESSWLTYTGGDFSNAGVAYTLNLKTGKSTLISDPMQSELKDIEFGKMEEWNFTASDGTEINGYMCLPPEFDSSRKYPLIVYYYGGTSPSSAAITHPYSPQVFASRDYVVYVLNPSGTTGYGQEFSARHVNAWGKRTAEDIIEGVKKFCEEHPFVDKAKVGCLGASYGGFMTQYLQTLTDIFAAAVSHAGISNVTSYWGEGFWGYSYNSIAAAKSYPWTNPDLFTKQGSLFNADKIHTPLLLLHGTDDTNVPIGESIQIFNALRLLGRTVEFITIEGQNHVITDFDKKLVWQDTIMAWFAKYLQDDPRWWEALYGN